MSDGTVSHLWTVGSAAGWSGTAPGPPVADAIRVSSRDVDESRDICSRLYFPIDLDVRGGERGFGFDLSLVRLGPLAIGSVTFGAPVAIGATDLDAYHINVPISGLLQSHHSGQRLTAAWGRAAVYRPVGRNYTWWSAGCRILAVKVDRAALENELELLLDGPVRGPLDLAPALDVATGPGRGWSGLLRLLHDEVENRHGIIHHPLIAERLWRGVLGGLLYAVDHGYREQLSRPAARSRPRPVKRAIDAIEAEPWLPFTIHQLAEIAGVSRRSLQEGFRRHLGVSPMTYLQQARLDRAHRDLGRADPAELTVAAVAQRWGFTHLGRFAGAYREKYGESPSATLRRSG